MDQQVILTPASAPSETDHKQEEVSTLTEQPPPYTTQQQYTSVDDYDCLTECYNKITERYMQDLTALKENITIVVHNKYEQDPNYSQLKDKKASLIQEMEAIKAVKIAWSEHKKAELLTEIDNKVAAINDEMLKYVDNKDRRIYILRQSINKVFKNTEQPVEIDRTHPDFIAEYERCIKILKPYVDQSLSGSNKNHVCCIKLRPTTKEDDHKLCVLLQREIKHGQSVLGFYLKGKNSTILLTLFSYLGFIPHIIENKYFVLVCGPKKSQLRFYTNLDTYVTDPSYAHDQHNFKIFQL